MKNQKYYSSKNETKIEDIKSQNKYYFIADCGHDFFSRPTSVFINNQLRCPVCSGRQVVKGVNDLWTTHPQFAKMLLNPDDGYNVSYGSNKNLNWVCPDCGAISLKSPMKMLRNISYCKECNKLKSYGENFVADVLDQLCEFFEREKIFDWSDKKRYDFYLPVRNCIIEVHGKQHYDGYGFSGVGGRTYIEEQINDEEKKELAIKNGIQYYIVIQSDKSEKDYLKSKILSSLLPTVLDFSKTDIDWNKCHENCMSNKTLDICDFYKNKSQDLKIIADYFGCSTNAIKNHLKNGEKLGWCDYNPEKGRAYGKEKTRKRIVEEMSKPIMQFDLLGNFIKEFSGIQQAQRELGVYNIWECLVGKKKTVGGFQWRYSNDCDNVSIVVYEKSGKPYKEVNQYDKQMNFIKTWPSIAEAAKELNIQKSNIISVCQKRQKTSGSYIWRYKNDDDND